MRPRLEAVSEWLGFRTPFLPRTRVSVHVASDFSVLCTGLVADRAALAAFVDGELAAIPGIRAVSGWTATPSPASASSTRRRCCDPLTGWVAWC